MLLAKTVADIIGVDTYASQEDVKDHAKLHDLLNLVGAVNWPQRDIE